MKLFKELKKGETVHILDRKSAEYILGEVEDAPSLPHYDARQPTMAVDVKIRIKDNVRTYTIPENLSVTYASDLCIATEQSDLLVEVTSLLKKAEDSIENYPRQVEIRDRCKALMEDLNPTLKAQRENDERFKKLEEGQSELASLLKQLINK